MDSYRRFLRGDDTGLEEIICSYKDSLMIYLNTFVRDMVIAEELTEETFVKLVLKRPRFFENACFKTWLYTIARNLAMDYLRRKKTDISLDDQYEPGADEVSLELTCIRQEEKIMLHRTMEKLKPEYRQVLWLSYFESFSHKQIGKIMGKSTHNIETLVYRARKALRLKLLEEGFEYENI